jgi:hypothetical protein
MRWVSPISVTSSHTSQFGGVEPGGIFIVMPKISLEVIARGARDASGWQKYHQALRKAGLPEMAHGFRVTDFQIWHFSDLKVRRSISVFEGKANSRLRTRSSQFDPKATLELISFKEQFSLAGSSQRGAVRGNPDAPSRQRGEPLASFLPRLQAAGAQA